MEASPFNPVKLDLGIILLLGLLLFGTHTYVVSGFAQQLALLGGFGLLSALWLGYRVRRILHQQQEAGDGEK